MEETTPARTPPKKTSMRIAAALTILALLLLATSVGAYWLTRDDPYASGASLIRADGLGTTDVQAHVNKLAEESMMTTAIPNPITVDGTHAYAVSRTGESGEEQLIPIIQNPAENNRDMKISIRLAEDGEDEEPLYQTEGLVRPGEGFETVELTRKLAPGSHKALAVFEGYDPETHELMGTRIWSITLVAI